MKTETDPPLIISPLTLHLQQYTVSVFKLVLLTVLPYRFTILAGSFNNNTGSQSAVFEFSKTKQQFSTSFLIMSTT